MDISMEDAPEAVPPPLFHDVYYSVVSPPQLPGEDPGFSEALETLDENGATHIPLDPQTGRIVLDGPSGKLTHIIATSSDFPDYEMAVDRYIPVVRPGWIQQSVAKQSQVQVRQFSPDPSHFLHDVVLCCADIPDGDKEAIAGGVIAMGGTYSEPLTRLCTHLIALSMDDPKVQAAVRKNLSCKILVPHWFDDCLRLKRRISEEPYLLPDPLVLQGIPDRPPKAKNNDDILHAMTPTPSSLPQSSSTQVKINCFRGRAIIMDDDLRLSNRTREALESIIKNGGGVIVGKLEAADTLICQYRENENFIKAVNAKLVVGNLAWLYHLIVHNRWTNPLLRLLHFPVPQEGIPGFEDFKISISNYTGFARIYLENLVKASGATFTKSMAQENTHLITAHIVSDKCDAAKEWNINIVNHLWLEDSYKSNRAISLTVGRYTTFPNGTNLGEVIGQTSIDKDIIKKYYLTSAGDEESIPEPDNEEPPIPTTTRKADPVIGTRKARQTATPAARKHDGKENLLPDDFITPGSRASKTKALSNIHSAAKDIALFNKEMKRKGGVTHGRDRDSVEVTPQQQTKGSVKRKVTPAEDEDDSDDLSEEQNSRQSSVRPSKKAKTGKTTKIKVLVSMYDRWKSKPESEQSDRAKLRNLGITVIQEPTPSGFILCAPKILRTKKFACALAYGPQIVDTEWLDICLTKKEVPEPEDYLLEDKAGEQANGFELGDALQRATQNKRKLLRPWQIFVTDKIPGGFETYKDIIETNGGTCHLFRQNTKMSVPKNKLNGLAPKDGATRVEDELFLISGVTTDEKKLWEPFRAMAKRAEMVPRIVKNDWLLSLALSQEIRFDKKWEHSAK